MLGGGQHAITAKGNLVLGEEGAEFILAVRNLSYRPAYFVYTSDSENGVHLGKLVYDVLAVTLGKATGYDYSLEIVLFLESCYIKYGLY